VVELNSYYVGLWAQAGILVAIAGEFLTDPYPAWTAVGVIELFDEEAVAEVRCIAAV
jgi:enamine deaminase RidA (YjgF/YER057c/UK114 family)